MQKICTKKCLKNIASPILKPAEDDCLYRCAFKFKEAIEFGRDALAY